MWVAFSFLLSCSAAACGAVDTIVRNAIACGCEGKRDQETMRFTPQAVEAVAQTIIRTRGSMRHFKAVFGVSPLLCSVVWNYMDDDEKLPRRAQPKHLLWTLMFLKLYNSENVLSSMCGCEEKTFRKWVWLMLAAIGSLEDVVRTTGHD